MRQAWMGVYKFTHPSRHFPFRWLILEDKIKIDLNDFSNDGKIFNNMFDVLTKLILSRQTVTLEGFKTNMHVNVSKGILFSVYIFPYSLLYIKTK